MTCIFAEYGGNVRWWEKATIQSNTRSFKQQWPQSLLTLFLLQKENKGIVCNSRLLQYLPNISSLSLFHVGVLHATSVHLERTQSTHFKEASLQISHKGKGQENVSDLRTLILQLLHPTFYV